MNDKGYLDWEPENPEAYALYREATEPLKLRPVINLALGAIDNAARAEALFKKARRAETLGIRQCAPVYREAAQAYHRRSLRQLRAAVKAADLSLSECDSDFGAELDAFIEKDLKRVMNREVLPDLRLRVLDSDLAPVEAGILFRGLAEGATRPRPIRAQVQELSNALKELEKERSRPDRGNRPSTVAQDRGVPQWKRVAVQVGVIIIRILIAICVVKFFIICLIIELIWRLVEKAVIEYVYRKCSDPQPET